MGTKNIHNLLDVSCAFFLAGYPIQKRLICDKMLLSNFGHAFVSSTA